MSAKPTNCAAFAAFWAVPPLNIPQTPSFPSAQVVKNNLRGAAELSRLGWEIDLYYFLEINDRNINNPLKPNHANININNSGAPFMNSAKDDGPPSSIVRR